MDSYPRPSPHIPVKKIICPGRNGSNRLQILLQYLSIKRVVRKTVIPGTGADPRNDRDDRGIEVAYHEALGAIEQVLCCQPRVSPLPLVDIFRVKRIPGPFCRK